MEINGKYMLIPTDTDQDKIPDDNRRTEPRDGQVGEAKVWTFLTRKQTFALIEEMTNLTHVTSDEDDGSNVLGFDERGNLMLNALYPHFEKDGISMATFAPDACRICGVYHPDQPRESKFSKLHDQPKV